MNFKDKTIQVLVEQVLLVILQLKNFKIERKSLQSFYFKPKNLENLIRLMLQNIKNFSRLNKILKVKNQLCNQLCGG